MIEHKTLERFRSNRLLTGLTIVLIALTFLIVRLHGSGLIAVKLAIVLVTADCILPLN